MQSLPIRYAFPALLILSLAQSPAEVRCPIVFGDHMVLQRDQHVPIWGEADPGEAVTIKFGDQTARATAGADGHWQTVLTPLPASEAPRVLTVQGHNTLSYADVLVGDVWFCSGQSNMEKPFGPRKGQKPTDNSDIEVAAARYPGLRLFQVPRTDLPQTGPGKLHWLPCTPDALRASGFSAVAYHFGLQLHQALGIPIGLIHSSFGGTFIDAWMPKEAFNQPDLAPFEHRHYAAWVKGVQPTELYQSMVAPYAPFGIRGFIWYQGETNLMDGDIALYAAKQTALIAAWRTVWREPNAPFYGVLVAPMEYSKWGKFPLTEAAEPAFWEQQVKALSAPNTGYAVTTDLVSDTHDIHPTNKRDVGLRLARLALAGSYARNDIEAQGPTYDSMRVRNDQIEVTFTHGDSLQSRNGAPLSGFTIAGDDRAFVTAIARIEGDHVIVSSDRVPKPAAVRFGWSEILPTNLVNGASLPAVPFRTDDWPLRYLVQTGAPEKTQPQL